MAGFEIKILNGGSRDVLKLIAAILMVFDHLAYVEMVPSIYNLIGRGVFPIFAYSLGCFLVSNPYSIRKYAIKMAVFAIFTQPIHFLLVGWMDNGLMLGNVFVTLLGGVLLGRFLLNNSVLPIIKHILIIAFILMGRLPFPVEYHLVGIVMPVLFVYVLQGKKWGWIYLLMAFYMLNAPGYNFENIEWYIKSLVLMVFALLVFYTAYIVSPILSYVTQLQKRFLNGLFLYIFYPVHMAIIVLCKML